MAKRNKEMTMNVIELMGHVRGDADGWGIAVMKMGWGDNPTTVDIRNVNLAAGIPGKGVSISDIETDSLVDILLEKDYGSIEALEEAIERRNGRVTYGELIPHAVLEKEAKEEKPVDISDSLLESLHQTYDLQPARVIFEDEKINFDIYLRQECLDYGCSIQYAQSEVHSVK